MKDYYYLLGVKPTATTAELKEVYRKLAKKFHPDTNDEDPFWGERFKAIQEAYATLIDPSERREYDRLYRLRMPANAFFTDKSRGTARGNSDFLGLPLILDFSASVSVARSGEPIRLTWHVINVDLVTISGLGTVASQGSADLTRPLPGTDKYLEVHLQAQNTLLNLQVEKTIKLNNEGYTAFTNRFRPVNMLRSVRSSLALTRKRSATVSYTLLSCWVAFLGIGYLFGPFTPDEPDSKTTPASLNTERLQAVAHQSHQANTEREALRCTQSGVIYVHNNTSRRLKLHLTWASDSAKGTAKWNKWEEANVWILTPGISGPLTWDGAMNVEAGGYRFYIADTDNRPLIGSPEVPVFQSTCADVNGITIPDQETP